MHQEEEEEVVFLTITSLSEHARTVKDQTYTSPLSITTINTYN